MQGSLGLHYLHLLQVGGLGRNPEQARYSIKKSPYQEVIVDYRTPKIGEFRAASISIFINDYMNEEVVEKLDMIRTLILQKSLKYSPKEKARKEQYLASLAFSCIESAKTGGKT